MEILDTLRAWAGSGEAIKDYKKTKLIIENAQKLLKRARSHALDMNPEAANFFRKQTAGLDAKLSGMVSAISKGESIYQAYEDAKKIKKAMEALSYKNGEIMRYDPEGAVTAFGVLFHGLGGFAKHLPAPVNAYGSAMQNIGATLCNTYKMLDPHSRQGWGGPQLKQLSDEGLKIGMYR